ncbi:MAG: hydroxymethylbilane synthase [Acidimicrobiales bacterium]
MPLRLATRGSPLARWQADWVAAALRPTVAVDLVIVETVGDRRQDVPLHVIGGQGVFVKEVQAAVLDGRADAAVHSAKDLPSATAAGLVLAAFGERGDPRDALVGSTLDGLAAGARVATGSVRRRAQLAHLRPDLEFHDLRGNIGTRLAKASDFDAVLMAVAALRRLGMPDRIAEAIDPAVMIPQVGQGAIAVECRAEDEETRAQLAPLDHRPTRLAVEAERAFLAMLGGGCTLPVGAYATVNMPVVSLHAVIASDDGSTCLTHRGEGSDPERLGADVARYLLDVAGGGALLGSDR